MLEGRAEHDSNNPTSGSYERFSGCREPSYTVYTDASHRDCHAGLGIVVSTAGSVRILSDSLKGIPDVANAEAIAASYGLRLILPVAGRGKSVRLVTDCPWVHDCLSGKPSVLSSVATNLTEAIEAASLADTRIECVLVKGHGRGPGGYRSRDAFLNGIADCLAHIGRHGSVVDHTFADDEHLRAKLVSFDWRLNPELSALQRRSYSSQEAAAEIGVDEDTVSRLVQHGYLVIDQDTGSRLTMNSVRQIAKVFAEMRAAAADDISDLERPQP